MTIEYEDLTHLADAISSSTERATEIAGKVEEMLPQINAALTEFRAKWEQSCKCDTLVCGHRIDATQALVQFQVLLSRTSFHTGLLLSHVNNVQSGRLVFAHKAGLIDDGESEGSA